MTIDCLHAPGGLRRRRPHSLALASAAIMIAVAAGFAADPSIMVKIIGVGMAVAILVDVTLVRMLVVPAVVAILGRWIWCLPPPLSRFAPHPETHLQTRREPEPTADADAAA